SAAQDPFRREFVMRSAIRITTILAAAALAGCTSNGLSPREVRGRDYSSYVLSMYDPDVRASAGQDAAQPPAVATPARIAVAQVGEVAPPLEMLEVLRRDRLAFASVQP